MKLKKIHFLLGSGLTLLCFVIPTLASCSKDYTSETFLMTQSSIDDYLSLHKLINNRNLMLYDSDPIKINEFLCDTNEVKIQNLINGFIKGFFEKIINGDNPNCKIRVDVGKDNTKFRFRFLNDYDLNDANGDKIIKGFQIVLSRIYDYFKINIIGKCTMDNGDVMIDALHGTLFNHDDMVLQKIYEEDDQVHSQH
jgi:hypothetical protein